MTLFSEDDYAEVMYKLVESLRWMGSWSPGWHVPTTAAISKGRQRLGWEPLQELFDRCAVPVAAPGADGAWLAGRRLMAIDGFCLDIADTDSNAEEFGRHSGAAFPQARVLALAECATHTITAAAVGGIKVSEQELAGNITGFLGKDMLVIADRNFYGFQLWRKYRETGADLLWRMPAGPRLPVLRALSDGSYLSMVAGPAVSQSRRDQMLAAAVAGADLDPDQAQVVRVVEYTIEDREGNGSGELICVITSLLDPHDANAADIAAAYHQRWEAENVFDELKTHQRGPGRILRSKSADMVKQEIWAMLLTHYCVRSLMYRAADEACIDPDRISFTRALRIIRRQVTRQADFSP